MCYKCRVVRKDIYVNDHDRLTLNDHDRLTLNDHDRLTLNLRHQLK